MKLPRCIFLHLAADATATRLMLVLLGRRLRALLALSP